MAYVVIQQHKFGRMYLCGWSKRWGATVCAHPLIAIKFPTEDEAQGGARSRGDSLPAVYRRPADRLAGSPASARPAAPPSGGSMRNVGCGLPKPHPANCSTARA